MDERLKKLVERLYEKTRHGQISWRRIDPERFDASFPRSTVEIQIAEPGNLVWLNIYNEEGEILDSTSEHALRTQGAAGHADMLREIHSMARRIALGADRAIDELLSALED